MDYSPPPLFKQGPSALARLVVFVLLAFVLLFTDAHFHTLKLVRQVVGTALYPLQRLALVPRDAALDTLGFFVSGSTLRAQNAALQKRNLQLGLEAARATELNAENSHLRALLQLSQQAPVKPIPAEIQYDTRDPFNQKVVIDHGMQSGVAAGAPVINEDGLIGQVTRVFPLQSEVTLLTDRDQAVPVQIVRTGVRSVIYGTANGDLLDLRFVPTGADVKPGDELVTSGLDGVYPSGLPVGRVLRVERQSDSAFANVVATPIAQIRGVRQLLVLHYEEALPPNPMDDPNATGSDGSDATASTSRKGGKTGGKESGNAGRHVASAVNGGGHDARAGLTVNTAAPSAADLEAARRASGDENRRQRAQAAARHQASKARAASVAAAASGAKSATTPAVTATGKPSH